MRSRQQMTIARELSRLRALRASRVDIHRRIVDSVPDDEVGDPVDHALAHISRGTQQMLLELEWRRLRAVDAAHKRLVNGKHDVCYACGHHISSRRHAVLPETTLCVACAAAREHGEH